MADPLSVAASVAGLLTAAQLVSVGIGKIVSSHKNGSKEIKDIKTTVETLRSVLEHLQLLLLNRTSVDPKRASMIMVDEIIATLTACVMTFADLDGCVRGLETDGQLGLLDSMKWVSKASELAGYLQNLESHKTSLMLMTNILTWYFPFHSRVVSQLILDIQSISSQCRDCSWRAESAHGECNRDQPATRPTDGHYRAVYDTCD